MYVQLPSFLDIKLYSQNFLTCVGFELSFRHNMSTYDVCRLKIVVSIIRFKSLSVQKFCSSYHFYVSRYGVCNLNLSQISQVPSVQGHHVMLSTAVHIQDLVITVRVLCLFHKN